MQFGQLIGNHSEGRRHRGHSLSHRQVLAVRPPPPSSRLPPHTQGACRSPRIPERRFKDRNWRVVRHAILVHVEVILQVAGNGKLKASIAANCNPHFAALVLFMDWLWHLSASSSCVRGILGGVFGRRQASQAATAPQCQLCSTVVDALHLCTWNWWRTKEPVLFRSPPIPCLNFWPWLDGCSVRGVAVLVFVSAGILLRNTALLAESTIQLGGYCVPVLLFGIRDPVSSASNIAPPCPGRPTAGHHPRRPCWCCWHGVPPLTPIPRDTSAGSASCVFRITLLPMLYISSVSLVKHHFGKRTRLASFPLLHPLSFAI